MTDPRSSSPGGPEDVPPGVRTPSRRDPSEAHGPLNCPHCGELRGLGRLLAHLARCTDLPGLRRPMTGLAPRDLYGHAVDGERYEA
jgi:hypothetical protein